MGATLCPINEQGGIDARDTDTGSRLSSLSGPRGRGPADGLHESGAEFGARHDRGTWARLHPLTSADGSACPMRTGASSFPASRAAAPPSRQPAAPVIFLWHARSRPRAKPDYANLVRPSVGAIWLRSSTSPPRHGLQAVLSMRWSERWAAGPTWSSPQLAWRVRSPPTAS